MFRHFIVSILLLITSTISAQDQMWLKENSPKAPKTEVTPKADYFSVNELVFHNGNTLQQEIANHFEYPDEAIDEEIQGRVIVQFKVNASGYIFDIKTAESAHPILAAEATRFMQIIAKRPFKIYPNNLISSFQIPIVFELE